MGALLRSGTLVIAIAIAGCSSSSPSAPAPAPAPTPAQMTAFARVDKVLLVNAEANGSKGALAVDTGNPLMLLNPASFPSSPDVGTTSFTVAGHTYDDVPVVTSTLSPASPDPAFSLGGLVGCPLLCNTVASFNYRDAVMTIGDSPQISGVGADTAIPFDFEGGGTTFQVNGKSVDLPQSRVVVNVDLEGQTYRMIVDTGATSITVGESVLAILASDGRKKLDSGSLQTAGNGASSATYTRAKKVTVGGVSVQDVVVVHDSAFDRNLQTIDVETGDAIFGSLGGSFLEHFAVTIDYPNHMLHLAPYTDTSFIVDAGRAVGFSVKTAIEKQGAVVSSVLAGSQAEALGIAAGDVVTSVDGTAVTGLSFSEIQVLLSGAVGSTKSVTFGSAAKNANQTLTVPVEEYFPYAP